VGLCRAIKARWGDLKGRGERIFILSPYIFYFFYFY